MPAIHWKPIRPGEQPIGALVDVVLIRERRARRRAAVEAGRDQGSGERQGDFSRPGCKQRTAEDARAVARPRLAMSAARPAIAVRRCRPRARATPVMPPLKTQRAARVVEQRLARRRGAEPPRLASVVVAHDASRREALRAAPEIGLFPAVPETRRASGTARRSSARGARARELGELVEAGAGARALRMREQDERRRSVARTMLREWATGQGQRRLHPACCRSARDHNPLAAALSQIAPITGTHTRGAAQNFLTQ